MAIDILVVNHQTSEDLAGFLASLNCITVAYNLFIGNVAPTQADDDVMLGYPGPCYMFEWEDNVGYARAVNEMAYAGGGDVIAIFNADVRIEPGSLDACVDALREHDDWGVLGPMQVDEAGRVTHAGIFGTNTEPAFRGWRSQSTTGYDDVREAVTVSGSAYFVKRDVWHELANCDQHAGAFLPTPLYYEETWCSYHAREHGHKVMYYGPARMIHKWHQSVLKSGEGEAMKKMKIAREMFRVACSEHGIACD